jgi:cyclophilin family peptidyl-prolyl cis-trans isomerase
MISKILIILVGVILIYLLYNWYNKTNEKFENIYSKVNTKQDINLIQKSTKNSEKAKNDINRDIQMNAISEINKDSKINDISEINKDNRYTFFDISLRDSYKNEKFGKIIIQLFNEETPKTCQNFYKLVKDKKYKNVLFHRVIKGFMIQGGDITNNDGTGGYSIYGDNFEDENFKIKHTTAGLLSMANSGPNTNGSQFFITVTPTPHLDNKHVVFGRVIEGLDIVNRIENQLTDNNDKPIQDCYINNCGILTKKEVDNLMEEKKNYINRGKLLDKIPDSNVSSPSLSY